MELVLNTFGTSINRDNEGFVIRSKGREQRVPLNGITAIQIGKGVQITSDAVMLAIENEIDILFVERTGMPMGRVWSSRYGSISTIRKGQLNFVQTPDALLWIQQIIAEKIANQQAMLLLMNADDLTLLRVRERNLNRLEDYRTKVMGAKGAFVADCAAQLRGWEGMASKIYFSTLNLFIPEQYRFEARSQHPARDVVNALLNYAYGMLYGKLEGLLIKAGIDPYIGVLHRDNYNRPVLVYDVIERYRIWADYVVYSLVNQQVVTDDFCTVQTDGACWLEDFGRRVLIQSVNDYLNEVVTINNLSRSRITHMMLYTQDLAQNLKKYI